MKKRKLPSVEDLARRWQAELPPSEFARRMDILLNNRHWEKRRRAESILLNISDQYGDKEIGRQSACSLQKNRSRITSGTAERLSRRGNLTGCFS